MKSLFEYLQDLIEDGTATPANTTGMGEPTNTEIPPVSINGIPHGDTKISKRKKRRKQGEPDFKMIADPHNV